MTREPLPEEDGAASSLEENSPEDRIARQLRRFGPLGILAILIILGGNYVFTPLSAILALVWASLSRTPWRDLGFVRPRSWARTIIVSVVFGVALKFAMKSIVMPLFGAPPVNQAFHYLAGNTAAIPWMLGSQFSFFTASASAWSFSDGFFTSHCWSCTISSGYVEAMKI